MRPYRNKTTPCTGFFFCTPLGHETGLPNTKVFTLTQCVARPPGNLTTAMRVSIDIAVQRCEVRKVVQMMQHASVHLAHHYRHRWYAGVSFASVLALLLRLMVEFMLAIDIHFQGVMVG